ncbi:MAG: lactonase family protein [Planctomycetota bacterium]
MTPAVSAEPALTTALIGSYTEPLGHTVGGGPGIVMVRIDHEGRITPVGEAAAIRNPSYISVNATGDRAYASSEITDFNGGHDGGITVLAVDAERNKLEIIQQVGSRGVGPAWVRFSHDGQHLLVANYLAGNAAVFPVEDDGRLGNPTAVLQHVGHGPITSRQEAPHPHAALTSPDGRWLYVLDLGIDEIIGYGLSEAGTAERIDTAGIELPGGTGPRHAVWSADGCFLYVGCELSSEITVLRQDTQSGALSVEQVLPSFISDMTDNADNHPSEIALSPDGRHIVIANRGRDTLAVFRVDPPTGRLIGVSETPTGLTPRHFTFSGPSQLILAEQEAHRVTSFRFDSASGDLSPTGHACEIPSPCFVCPLPG